jgi:hypothetical protein
MIGTFVIFGLWILVLMIYTPLSGTWNKLLQKCVIISVPIVLSVVIMALSDVPFGTFLYDLIIADLIVLSVSLILVPFL